MIFVPRNQCLILLIFFSLLGYAQEDEQQQKNNEELFKRINFFDLRGTNTIDLAAGASLINSDYPNAEFGLYIRLGYKHFVTDHLNVNFSYNNYKLVFGDTFDESYTSFDFNFEYLFRPYHKFSPFAHAGFGYNASKGFETSQTKVQAALGVEYIVANGVGIKLFGEFNQVFADELEGLILPDKDDSLLRFGLGVNFYFGGSKRKERLMNSIDTIINSNLIK